MQGAYVLCASTYLQAVLTLRLLCASPLCANSVCSVRRYLVTGGADALVALWDLDDAICVRTWAHMDGVLRSVSISYDNAYVAYVTDSRELEILGLRTGERIQELPVRWVLWCAHRHTRTHTHTHTHIRQHSEAAHAHKCRDRQAICDQGYQNWGIVCSVCAVMW